LGGFIGSRNDGNHYAKTARDDERKSTPKKIQIGEEGRRDFSESCEENPTARRSIPNRQFCIRSTSTVAGEIIRNDDYARQGKPAFTRS
jgi:hypothetical protein